MQPSFPRQFNILVPALVTPSDPSRGPAGNPRVARGGFTLSLVNTRSGTARVGGPVQTPPAPSALAYTAAIEVDSADYWDPTVAPPAPLLLQEEVAVFDNFIVASEEFGQGQGSGAGPLATVATTLANALNKLPMVKAAAVGAIVYITSLSEDATLPLKATDDMSVILSGTPFLVSGPGGVLLSVSPQYRQTFFIVKPFKTQAPPTSLPPVSP